MIDECRRGIGDEHLEIGRAVGRRRFRVGLERGGNGGQVVVGRSEPVQIDAADGREHLLTATRNAPRRRERARLEESRDGFRPQETSAANTYRWLLPRLFHPQPDGVLDRRRLRGGGH